MPTLSTGKPLVSRRAFTLVEIIVVIVIIAVLSGMVALSLEGRSASAQLRATAGDLLRFAQYGRDYAVTRATSCRLVIDPQAQRFHLERETEQDGQPAGYQVVTADAMRPRTLPRGVTFGFIRIEGAPDAPAAGSVITFTALGDAEAAAIEITDGKHSFTLRIAPGTGRAEVVDGREVQLLSDRMDLDA